MQNIPISTYTVQQQHETIDIWRKGTVVRGLFAVSYTHLDVYKRQVDSSIGSRMPHETADMY